MGLFRKFFGKSDDELAQIRWRQKLESAVDVLHGLCAGIMADGVLKDDEILFLSAWLNDHQDVCSVFPGSVIAARVRSILADGQITETERADLVDVLKKLLGGTLQETGSASSMPIELPLSESIISDIEGMTVCLTGRFMYGTRDKCYELVYSLGGTPVNTITKKVDVLFLGSFVSRAWVHENYGRKIEKAVDYRNRFGKPEIHHETSLIEIANIQ